MVGIMITDGGPHPAEKWARATAAQIIDIGTESPMILLQEARKFEDNVIAIMTHHHTKVQDKEKAGLMTNEDHCSNDLDPSAHISDPVDQIIMAARGTTFEKHFNSPEVRQHLHNLLGIHFSSVMHIERLWHADRNPTNQAAQAYKAAGQQGE